jgi:MtN3 and saliva related transmembrane protein
MIIKLAAAITGILMSLGYYPQLWKIFKTKSARDISIPSFVIFGIGTLSWFIYGWYLHDIVIILSFGLGVIGSWAILFSTFYYREKV